MIRKRQDGGQGHTARISLRREPAGMESTQNEQQNECEAEEDINSLEFGSYVSRVSYEKRFLD